MSEKLYKPSETITITDEELQSLALAIFKRHGIDFTCYERLSLKRRIIRAMGIFNIDSIHGLWTMILSDRAFIYSFMDEISVGLTALFRDPVLWRKLKSLLRNDQMISKSSLAIWHAGCSTGEEIYSMGIVLKESMYEKPVTAWATDISKQSIDHAQRGEYHQMKFQEYEQNYKEYNIYGSLKNYAVQDAGSFRMYTGLVDHVTFEYHNLITDQFNKKFDIIFCRNVMIYFDNGAKSKLLKKFHESLNPGGLLIIGFYDAIMSLIDPDKFQVLDLNAKIFIKVE
ncbi:CheR family methyltransferase [Ohtaekwangia koreensis]|uniref:Chemotaxis protein methyltransferase CheR n=1 Tax=Ohtaekwangia koreensis TaxID=688867 RepID=A0A1T5JSH2_9BACT|nr:protein-glutamate O-methyltransferase CheR [Ohtaekwangia koreensis]SKC54333.1 chemotaxis protein methyltransferase CheR [Ohtaekwangia koreensis]